MCKKCGCPLPKRVKITATEQKSATREPKVYAFDNKVSSLLDSGILPDGSEIYSIKIREQGPDYRYCNEILNTSGKKLIRFSFFCYRCFVTYVSGQWYCHFNECALAYDGRRRSYPDANQASIVCQHIKEAQNSQCSRECA